MIEDFEHFLVRCMNSSGREREAVGKELKVLQLVIIGRGISKNYCTGEDNINIDVGQKN